MKNVANKFPTDSEAAKASLLLSCFSLEQQNAILNAFSRHGAAVLVDKQDRDEFTLPPPILNFLDRTRVGPEETQHLMWGFATVLLQVLKTNRDVNFWTNAFMSAFNLPPERSATLAAGINISPKSDFKQMVKRLYSRFAGKEAYEATLEAQDTSGLFEMYSAGKLVHELLIEARFQEGSVAAFITSGWLAAPLLASEDGDALPMLSEDGDIYTALLNTVNSYPGDQAYEEGGPGMRLAYGAVKRAGKAAARLEVAKPGVSRRASSPATTKSPPKAGAGSRNVQKVRTGPSPSQLQPPADDEGPSFDEEMTDGNDDASFFGDEE